MEKILEKSPGILSVRKSGNHARYKQGPVYDTSNIVNYF